MEDHHRQTSFAKARYGYCDSYFVESQDDQERRHRDEMRERERQAKKLQQVEIAEQLSALASHELRDDHIREMERMELETLPDVASIDIQTEIKWYMRPYLLDFLIEAHQAFGLLPETLFLTVNLLDRYCSRRIVYKKHYQLVGCAALLIASKYGDRKDRVPTIKELKNMCCSLYDEDMFLQMEWHVLQTLNWIIGHPTTDSFLQIAVEHHPFDAEVEHMACYIAEISMFERDFIGERASNMAKASLALARCILGRPQEHYKVWAGQFESETLMALAQLLHRPSIILSRKYSSAHFSRVATILDNFLVRSQDEARVNSVHQAPPTATTAMPAPSYGPTTPLRKQLIPSYNNGCPTPPDTPTGEDFLPNQQYMVGGCRPPTPPTPPGMGYQQHGSNDVSYQTHYTKKVRLPPIASLGMVY